MINIKNIFFPLLLFSQFLFSQSISGDAGTASNIFLRTALSAKTTALGEAYSGVANDENSLFYNPAGLINMRKTAIALNHTQWFEDIKIDNLILASLYKRNWAFALGVSHLWMPEIEGFDFSGNKTSQDISVSSTIVNLGLAYKVHPAFSIGVGIKYFNDKLSDYSANGVAFDAGFYMRTLLRGLTFGAAAQNLGGKIKYDVQSEKLPMVLRAGFGYLIPGSDARLSFDVIKAADTEWLLAMGLEYTFLNSFALRFGNQFKSSQTFSPGFGAGFNFEKQLILDYAFSPTEELGSTHRVGLTYKFNIAGFKAKKSKTYLINNTENIQTPSDLKAKVFPDKVVISWLPILNVGYNVYVRLNPESSWRKVNKETVLNAIYEFKKPSGINKLHLCVTSFSDGRESEFSKELVLDVK